MVEHNDINTFLGRGWSFPPRFSRTLKGVVMISGEEDIKSSLEILIGTRIGERIMQPGYGCNVHDMLFQPIDQSMKTYIKDLIFTAIYMYEPRVIPEDVSLSVDPGDGILAVEIVYTIRSTNARHNIVYPFYINEGTLLKR